MSADTFPHGRAGFKKLGCHCDDCEFRRHQPGYVDKGCRCRVCKDGQNEYITAQRNRKKNGGRKSARTRGRSVTRSEVRPGATQSPAERSQRDQAASTPASPHGRAVSATDPGKGQGESPARMGNVVAPPVAPPRSPGAPPERPESPAKRSRPTGDSKAPGWEMPHVWPTGEPAYAEQHRQALAKALTDVIARPNIVQYITMNDDADKTEAKDLAKLLKAFQAEKKNKGLLRYRGVYGSMKGFMYGAAYYSYEFIGDGHNFPNNDEETADDEEPESKIEETSESAPRALVNVAQADYSARSMSYTFHRAFREGTCTMTVKDASPCGNIADGTYQVTGHDVCEKHYEEIKTLYPSRVTYVRPGWDYSAPNIGTTPARGPRNL